MNSELAGLNAGGFFHVLITKLVDYAKAHKEQIIAALLALLSESTTATKVAADAFSATPDANNLSNFVDTVVASGDTDYESAVDALYKVVLK